MAFSRRIRSAVQGRRRSNRIDSGYSFVYFARYLNLSYTLSPAPLCQRLTSERNRLDGQRRRHYDRYFALPVIKNRLNCFISIRDPLLETFHRRSRRRHAVFDVSYYRECLKILETLLCSSVFFFCSRDGLLRRGLDHVSRVRPEHDDALFDL